VRSHYFFTSMETAQHKEKLTNTKIMHMRPVCPAETNWHPEAKIPKLDAGVSGSKYRQSAATRVATNL